ncbi:MAG: ferrous iron transport protein A [Deltaproteobacteria bacterium]|nr:ferrous iron transport protein A [Deltaproteobacteria bacterium]
MVPLGLLSEGEQGEIAAVRLAKASCHDSSRAADCRVEDLGLRVGKRVEMLTNAGGGPLLLKVDESRIAVDRALAMKILVRR